MTLIHVAVVLIVIGVLWLINRFIPMTGSIRSIVNVFVVIAVGLWLLKVSAFSVISPQSTWGSDPSLFIWVQK